MTPTSSISNAYPKPIGPWFPRPTRGAVRLIKPEELRAWTLYQDDRLIVVDKPGDLVCHPSKDGPWSSLVGAVKESLQVPTVHLVFRLDRETSGLVVFAKKPGVGSRLQTAAQDRRYRKVYQAICWGEIAAPVTVDQPLGPDWDSPVNVKSRVVPAGEGQAARTTFTPLARGGGFTLLEVTTETGRKHQIRAHAQWLGHPLVGDKIYGPDAALFLDFVENGWSARLAEKLLLPRQALHCCEIDLRLAGETHVFKSPLPEDMRTFCRERGIAVR
ncbi:MAG TPA: RluA family pseudouridine synthase [Opitutaceae bacterium]|nr:RluA family pseudouridine synthase [Opitutaceae bacterium]